MYAGQITALYNGGASVEDIAVGMEISLEEVKTVLLHTSPKFRSQSLPSQTEIPLEDEMLQICANIARHSDNDLIRLSAAKYVRDDKKGRRDLIPPDAGMNVMALSELQAGLVMAQKRRAEFLKGRNAIIELPGGAELSDRPDSGEANNGGTSHATVEIVPAGN